MRRTPHPVFKSTNVPGVISASCLRRFRCVNGVTGRQGPQINRDARSKEM